MQPLRLSRHVPAVLQVEELAQRGGQVASEEGCSVILFQVKVCLGQCVSGQVRPRREFRSWQLVLGEGSADQGVVYLSQTLGCLCQSPPTIAAVYTGQLYLHGSQVQADFREYWYPRS